MVPTGWYLVLAAFMFVLGLAGVIVRRNAIVVLMSIELVLNAGNLTIVAFARHHGDVGGHAVAFFVIAVAAAEASIGLALLIHVFRHFRSVHLDDLAGMKN